MITGFRNTGRRASRLAAVVGLGAGAVALSACTTDPAFWEAVAMGLDDVAYELAYDQANCVMIPDGRGGVMRDCGDPNAIRPGDVIYLPGVD